YQWFCAEKINQTPASLCENRDRFHTRLMDMRAALISRYAYPQDACYLLTAVIGELGNNCFDHNVTHWKDEIGANFGWFPAKDSVWIAVSDRGRGLLSSLRNAVKDLKNSQEAIDLAFHYRITS